MMPGGRRFDPAELRGADELPAGDAEQAAILAAARELEALASAATTRPAGDFVDRVMRAVGREPAPTAAGLLVGLRQRPGLASFLATVRGAWAMAVGGPGRPFGVRAAALAYVLVVAIAAASITGVAAYGAAGALGLLEPDRSTPPPSQVIESPEPSSLVEPSPSAPPSPSVQPDESAEPSETPASSAEESVDPSEGGGSSPSASPSQTEDPEESKTPGPSSTPDSSGTPEPSASDD